MIYLVKTANGKEMFVETELQLFVGDRLYMPWGAVGVLEVLNYDEPLQEPDVAPVVAYKNKKSS